VTQEETAARLEHQAFHDPLTDLPNRAFARDRLARAVSGRDAARFALLYLDLDNFKLVNDSLGHAAGDQLLVAVARRLRASVHPQDMVARLGVDEFLVLLEEAQTLVPAAMMAERLAAAVEAPLYVNDQELRVAASIGIAYGDPSVPPEEWMRQADIALHEAKASGKTRHVVADAAMASRARHRLTLEQELRHALDKGELAVYYQPKVALATSRIVGWEALVRWRHPLRGIIAPAAFIPLAEETGLIVPLGDWVLREACSQVVRWQHDWSTPLTMSVNLSVRQVWQAALVDSIAGILSDTELAPDCLELELTETMAMADPERSITILGRLQGLGVRLALDDFGSGYSSLRSLQRLPLDVLKIDRSLAADLGRDQHTAGILQTVVTLGHTLGLTVVAEGVETASQAAQLRSLCCDFGQGYYFGRPVEAAIATALLAGQLGRRSTDSAAG
jgi:diguanylate cyclase (GGDEF)-like protein